ncbi:MAG: hypothetical protein FJ202_01620 [Gemmatimonadetes bacterium]|nr:hypothetical protein [Gemmatimonadota bacterium]
MYRASWFWVRVASLSYAFFGGAHTAGMLVPAARGAEEANALAAIGLFEFDVMGVRRSHLVFYEGLGWLLTANLALLACVLWALSSLARRDAALARPLILCMALGAIPIAGLCWWFFFPAPGVISTLAAVSLAIAVRTAKA